MLKSTILKYAPRFLSLSNKKSDLELNKSFGVLIHQNFNNIMNEPLKTISKTTTTAYLSSKLLINYSNIILIFRKFFLCK